MPELDAVLQAIYAAIDDLQPTLQPGVVVERAPGTVLFGRGGALDSLGVVTLIIGVEQQLEERMGWALTLADERAMSQKHSPFRTIGSLAEYIVGLVAELGRG